jgi:hypothetical protein
MPRLICLARGFRRFLRLAGERRSLLVEASLCLLWVQLTLVVVPFPKLARRIGGCLPPADPRAIQARQNSILPEQSRIAREVGWAVTRAAQHSPFRVMCLPQALGARAMLARRGMRSVLHFGTAARKEAPLVAHVWLEAAGVEVTGYPVREEFTEIASFV